MGRLLFYRCVCKFYYVDSQITKIDLGLLAYNQKENSMIPKKVTNRVQQQA